MVILSVVDRVPSSYTSDFAKFVIFNIFDVLMHGYTDLEKHPRNAD